MSINFQQQNIMRNCVMAARVTLTHFVWVQILVPQPKSTGFIKDSVDFFVKYSFDNLNNVKVNILFINMLNFILACNVVCSFD